MPAQKRCADEVHVSRTVGNVQALGANGKAAFSPKAHG